MSLGPRGNMDDAGQQPVIVLARWSTRFWAWLVDARLVDAIIVNVALGELFGLMSMPMWRYGFTNPRMMVSYIWQ